MELTSLERLEAQVNRLLDEYKKVSQERQQLTAQLEQTTEQLDEARRSNGVLRVELEEARRMARDPEKESRIKAKVEELLAKLEGF